MLSSEVRTILTECCQTMEAAAAALKDRRPELTRNSPPEALAQAKARLSQAAEAVRLEVAKCAVVGVGGLENPSVAASMLDALQQRMLALCALLSDLQARGGLQLSLRLQNLAELLVKALVAFVSALGHDDTSSVELNRLAGVVFQRCLGVRSAPLSEKAAIGRSVLQIASQLRDVIREVQELKDANSAESESSPNEAASAPGNPIWSGIEGVGSALKKGLHVSKAETQPEELDADLDYQADSASPGEAAVVATGLKYLNKLSDLLEMLLRILQSADLQAQSEQAAAWGSTLSHLQKMADPINDFGACLYPPQDARELQDICDSLGAGLEKLKKPLGLLQDSSSLWHGTHAASCKLKAAIEGLAGTVES